MSNVFSNNISALGTAAVQKAEVARNKYNQELQKREMVSQTEESLGGIKLFTSGRELGAKILKDSKIKDYVRQKLGGKPKPKPKPKGKEKPKGEEGGEEGAGDEGAGDSVIQMGEIGQVEPDIVPAVKVAARSVSNDISDARLARIGRIAKTRKIRKIQKGMSEDDAEADSDLYIRNQVERLQSKQNLNRDFKKSADDQNAANEQAQAEAQAETEARANLKAAAQNKAKVKGKGKKGDADEEEDAAGGDEEAAAGAGEDAADITGIEAFSSVLDAIPGLDLIGAALGVGGLVAGFTKKPPHEIVNQMTRGDGSNSYSAQLGLN